MRALPIGVVVAYVAAIRKPVTAQVRLGMNSTASNATDPIETAVAADAFSEESLEAHSGPWGRGKPQKAIYFNMMEVSHKAAVDGNNHKHDIWGWGFGNRQFFYAVMLTEAKRRNYYIHFVTGTDRMRYLDLAAEGVLTGLSDLFAPTVPPAGGCVAWGGDGFRCPHGVRTIHDADRRHLYQTENVVKELFEERSMLIRRLDLGLKRTNTQISPAQNDVVIHFRDCADENHAGQRERPLNLFNEWRGMLRSSCALPYAHYDEILKRIIYENRPPGWRVRNIWIVCASGARNHPTLKMLAAQHGAHFYLGDNAADDFRFVVEATNLIMSVSTWVWWAAFRNEVPGARLYWPVNPGGSPGPVCALFPGHYDESWAARVVYYDWYNNKTYPSTIHGAQTAQEDCAKYEVHSLLINRNSVLRQDNMNVTALHRLHWLARMPINVPEKGMFCGPCTEHKSAVSLVESRQGTCITQCIVEISNPDKTTVKHHWDSPQDLEKFFVQGN